MKYSSTRGLQQNLSYNEVLLQGLARDGGLFVPNELPVFTNDELKKASKDAIKQKYKFFRYGDAMLLNRKSNS